MIIHFIAGFFTIGPIVGILYWFYRMDANREPFGKIMKTFWLGVVCTIPAILIAWPSFVFGQAVVSPITRALLIFFLAAAIPEEFAKLLVIRLYSARLEVFDEPMDGLVYGATAALGFAALENVLYVWSGTLATAVLRAFTAVPIHAIAGAIIGYSIALTIHESGSRLRTWMGFTAATLLHGIYDFGLLTVEFSESSSATIALLLLLPLGMLIFGLIWLYRTTRHLRTKQLAAMAGEQTTNRRTSLR